MFIVFFRINVMKVSLLCNYRCLEFIGFISLKCSSSLINLSFWLLNFVVWWSKVLTKFEDFLKFCLDLKNLFFNSFQFNFKFYFKADWNFLSSKWISPVSDFRNVHWFLWLCKFQEFFKFFKMFAYFFSSYFLSFSSAHCNNFFPQLF